MKKTGVTWAALLVCMVLALLIVGPSSSVAMVAHHPGLWLVGMAGMVTVPWDPPMTFAELTALSDPQSAGEPEVIVHQLYDTQTLATGTAGPLYFFTAQNSDKTLSNMEGPGQLPSPQFMQVQYVACDMLVAPVLTAAATGVNTVWSDIENVLKTCRASWTFTMASKNYGPYSLTMCQSTGGATGSGYGYGTAASGVSAAIANNGMPASGGFPWGGSIVIPPKINFSISVFLGANCTLNATMYIRMSLVGALYRKVS